LEREAVDPNQKVRENTEVGTSERAILQHEKEFRDSVAISLSEGVSQAKGEVEQVHPSGIFSVKIFKQGE